MKNTVLSLLLLLAFIPASFAQVKWEADAMHTNVRFSVEHMGISFVDGEFTKVEGHMTSPSATTFDGATFNYTIQVNSIDTRVKPRDSHLLTNDFFNAAKYPTITLKNATLHKIEGNHYELTGELSIRDVTKTVTFDVTFNGEYTDSKGRTHAGFTATTTIDRTDYNINYGGTLPNGDLAVGNMIKIVVNSELIKKG